MDDLPEGKLCKKNRQFYRLIYSCALQYQIKLNTYAWLEPCFSSDMKKSIFMFIPGLLLLSQIALAQATQDKACGLDYGLSPIGPCAPNADVAKAEMKRLEKNIEEKVEQAVQIYTHRDAAKDNAIDAAKVAAGTMSSFAYNYWKSLQQPEYSRSFSKNNFRVFDKIA